jgi:hypothetical protein
VADLVAGGGLRWRREGKEGENDESRHVYRPYVLTRCTMPTRHGWSLATASNRALASCCYGHRRSYLASHQVTRTCMVIAMRCCMSRMSSRTCMVFAAKNLYRY